MTFVYEVLEYGKPQGSLGFPLPPQKSHGFYDTQELAQTKMRDLAREEVHPITDTHFVTHEVHSTPSPWWADHRNLTMTAEFMRTQDHSLEDIIYMLEKPWKHDDDYNLAQVEVDLPLDLTGET